MPQAIKFHSIFTKKHKNEIFISFCNWSLLLLSLLLKFSKLFQSMEMIYRFFLSFREKWDELGINIKGKKWFAIICLKPCEVNYRFEYCRLTSLQHFTYSLLNNLSQIQWIFCLPVCATKFKSRLVLTWILNIVTSFVIFFFNSSLIFSINATLYQISFYGIKAIWQYHS